MQDRPTTLTTSRDPGRAAASRLTLLAVALAGLLAVAPLATATDASATQDGGAAEASVETHFSHPTWSGLPDDAHEEIVSELLQGAVPGTSVHFAIYTFTRDNMAQDFIDAADRGVDVNLLIDEWFAENDVTQRLLDELPDDVKIVHDGGVGDNNMHNKFLTVEELDNGDRDVVWQSSSNLTNSQRWQHNSSVVIRNDPAMHDTYVDYWHDLDDEDFTDLSYNRTEESETASVYFSPRDDFDTHVRALEDVVCTDDSIIHFNHAAFTDAREASSDLINVHLRGLVDDGCEVRAVINAHGIGNAVGDLLEDAGVDVLDYPEYDPDRDNPGRPEPQPLYVHSKDMLIASEFATGDGGTEWREEVWTGAQNLTSPGLFRNDEALLRIVDDDVYQQFRQNWERIHRSATLGHRLAEGGRGPRPRTVADDIQTTADVGMIGLSWSTRDGSDKDKDAVDHYQVHASESAEFPVGEDTLLAETTDPGLTHRVGPDEETWHYQIVVVNEAGNAGRPSEEVTASSDRSVTYDGQQVAAVGDFDGKSLEFALAPDGFADYPDQFPDGVDFTVGVDDPGQDWPYLHPGEADAWAGSQSHELVFRFDLDAQPEDDLTLVMWLIDTHGSLPGTVHFGANDQDIGSVDLPPGAMRGSLEGDTTVDGTTLRPVYVELPLPREDLVPGENVLTIDKPATGVSWHAYDAFGVFDPSA